MRSPKIRRQQRFKTGFKAQRQKSLSLRKAALEEVKSANKALARFRQQKAILGSLDSLRQEARLLHECNNALRSAMKILRRSGGIEDATEMQRQIDRNNQQIAVHNKKTGKR